ncbi:MAG: hypothetical protein IPH35_12820 [Rhodoferax sp.]|nr:hypothetical protein [Rhodoferax sp.]
MTTYSIPNPVELIGEWTVPSESESLKIPGALSWSSQRATLTLQNSFSPLRGAVHAGNMRTYPAVHGVTTGSEYVSMLQASSAGTGMSFGAAGMRQSERLISSWAIVGAHVFQETLYSEVSIRIPGLQLWLCRSCLSHTLTAPAEGVPFSLNYRLDSVPEEVFEVPNISSTFVFGYGWSTSGNARANISIETSAYLRIRPNTSKDLEWYFEQIGKATTLLSLVSGSPMAPDQVSAKLPDDGPDVQILVALREAKYCSFKNHHDFFMLRDNAGIALEEIINRWFEVYDSVAMPSQLALSVLNSEMLWLHVEFLSLMQALEGLHRSILPGLYATEEQYEGIKQALSNAIPKHIASDHKDALRARIKYGNEISLRKRLAALVERLPVDTRKHILGGNGSIPQSWVATRNYYTHWDEASKDAVLDGVEMHRAHVRMRHLLRALYLNLIGIPDIAIANSLQNTCNESQYLMQLNSMDHRRQNPKSDAGAIMNISVNDSASPDESLS